MPSHSAFVRRQRMELVVNVRFWASEPRTQTQSSRPGDGPMEAEFSKQVSASTSWLLGVLREVCHMHGRLGAPRPRCTEALRGCGGMTVLAPAPVQRNRSMATSLSLHPPGPSACKPRTPLPCFGRTSAPAYTFKEPSSRSLSAFIAGVELLGSRLWHL